MKRGLIVCRTGMGSSMMIRIKVDQVLKEIGKSMILEHDVLSGLGQYHDIDVVITMSDLVPEIEDKVSYCIGIENIVDKEALRKKLVEFFEKTT
jgi:ascorbate PTS system EIIB component